MLPLLPLPRAGVGLCAVLLVALAACAPVRPALRAGRSLQETVDAHVAAIGARDLDALVATITPGPDLPLIFPDGSVTRTRQEYIDFHRAWFADTGWTFRLDPVSTVVRSHVGVALFRTAYTDAGGTREGLVALTFALDDGAWRLVFDQNTRVGGQAPSADD